MTTLTRPVLRSTSDKRLVAMLLPGDKVAIRKYRHRSGQFIWSIADLYRVMARAAADAELERKRANGRTRK